MPDVTPRQRRTRQDIVLEILRTAEGGAKKTHIMYEAHLSYPQLQKYLNALKKADFLAEESGIWKTTKKGLHVIEACKICHNLLCV